MIRVRLPSPLQVLAGVGAEVEVEVSPPCSIDAVLRALEAAYPGLRGTIRDPATGRRRAFVRLFAEERDLSHDPVEDLLPPSVVDGREPLIVLGAISGG